MIVGITGLSASGKSALANLLVEKGWRLVDLDRVGHRALRENKETIVQAFGSAILDARHTIDRKKLGAIVFRSVRDRLVLESIVHPYMCEQVKQSIRAAPQEHWVIDAALLFYMKLDIVCDQILYLRSSFWIRLYRLLCREKNIGRVIRLLRTQRGLFAQLDANLSDVENVYDLRSRRQKSMQIKRILEYSKADGTS